VFGAQARFHERAVETLGNSTNYVRVGDEGRTATFHFCPQCGSTVYYRLEGQPDHVAVPVGAFADPGFPAPTFSIYEERKQPWVGLPAAIKRLD